MSFGQRIRFIRGNFSQQDFAFRLGVHRNTVCAWECDEIIPKGGIVKVLFKLFNVNLNWLFSGKGNPYLENFDQLAGNKNLIVEPESE